MKSGQNLSHKIIEKRKLFVNPEVSQVSCVFCFAFSEPIPF